MTLPNSLLLGYYGDDFTGSTDVMEALALAGLRTVLFLAPPTVEQIARFEGLRAVGIAGVSRSLETGDMAAELAPNFAALRALNTPLVHYKVCSTFDSSPDIGSIGRAIEIGRETFPGPYTPLVVAAPVLGRYQAFGNLFARSGGDSDVFRLDRHPSMAQHPVTPMRDSDLRRHLLQQTGLSIGLIDFRALDSSSEGAARLADEVSEGAQIVLFDVLTDAHLATIGGLLWDGAQTARPLFVAGSSGIEYALTTHWQASGQLRPSAPRPTFGPAKQILVASGSGSPVAERQIDRAEAAGFVTVALDPARLLHEAASKAEQNAALDRAASAMASGRSVILHTCRGPNDSRIAATLAALEALGYRDAAGRRQGGRLLAQALGRLTRRSIAATGARRIVVAGGDTSGYVARELGIETLEMLAPVAPGSPLCRVTASDPTLDGTEMLFKGGQVGKDDLYLTILRGTRDN